MAKKKKGFVSKFIKGAVAKRNPVEAVKSSKVVGDALTYIAPAVAGYAVARTVGRVTRNYIAPRFKNPVFVKPLQILGNATALAALWYLSSKWRSISKYRAGLIAGAGLATAQSVIELVFPKLGWVFDPPKTTLQEALEEEEAEEALAEYEGGAETEDEGINDAEPAAADNEEENLNTGVFTTSNGFN